MAELYWGTVVSIVYFTLVVLLVVYLAGQVYASGKNQSKMTFLKALWDKRGIYNAILVHFCDTSTDIGILIEWAILAQREAQDDTFNIETLDMSVLFWTSIFFLILYRIISALVGFYSAKSDDRGCCYGIVVDGFLGLIDMYVIKAAYAAIKQDADEPTFKQRMIQLIESIFESLPQIVLQSVFMVRSQNDPVLRAQNNWLVFVSLLASLWSVASKFIYADRYGVVGAAEKFLVKKKPNGLYVLRVSWRFSLVIVRFLVISLMWTALGGRVLIFVFLPASYALWLGLCALQIFVLDSDQTSTLTSSEKTKRVKMLFAFSVISLVSMPSYKSILFAVGHAIETLLALSIITLFAFDASLPCAMCSIRAQSQAMENSYIFGFVIAGWLAISIDLITSCLMLSLGVFRDAGDSTFLAVFEDGIQERARTVEEQSNLEIEQGLMQAKKSVENIETIVLFGLPNSGKNVIFDKLCGNEIEAVRRVSRIRGQCVSAMLCLLWKSQELYDEDEKENADTVVETWFPRNYYIRIVASYRGNTFEKQSDGQQSEIRKLGQCLQSLWRVNAVQAAYTKCEHKLAELENMRYFFDQVELVFDEEYAASNGDYYQLPCLMREKIGCIEHAMWTDSNNYMRPILCFPSCLSWNRKWIGRITWESIIPIFVIVLSDYSVSTDGENAMHIAIQSFHEICSLRTFSPRMNTIIVVLSKDDVFRKRLRAQIPLSECFSSSVGWSGKPWDGLNYCPIENDTYADDAHFEECYQNAIDFVKSVIDFVERKPKIEFHVKLSDEQINEKLSWSIQGIVNKDNITKGGLI